MILDLDTGIDDAMALAYAIACKEIELIGVTGTYGNVYTEVGVQNVLDILHMLGVEGVPVCAGEEHAISKRVFERMEVSARIHGENGVGQVSMETSLKSKESISGVDFIIESIKKHGQDLVIVTTGPLTNLATALKTAPEITEFIGRVVIMGGALTVPGNVNAYTEANVSQDPEATKYVFESGVDVTMVGLDVTQRSILTTADTQLWRKTGSIGGRTYADMVDYYISQHSDLDSSCYLHDPSAVIQAIHPEYFTTLPMHMTVVTEGEAAGRTIGDPFKLRDPNPNVKVCLAVDSSALVKDLNYTLLSLFGEQTSGNVKEVESSLKSH
ncbi:nucleoside hydrolase [Alicyclobacillus sp. ALC3]|uniref:nucleoside hydrolase n=1 Tax=Alicyclobacillus sp. ALC3 TaxID=2796143 RepID=UPI002379977C|nr:nucleoside hydrolase [Alicyclobacillus sp. ALC3]